MASSRERHLHFGEKRTLLKLTFTPHHCYKFSSLFSLNNLLYSVKQKVRVVPVTNLIELDFSPDLAVIPMDNNSHLVGFTTLYSNWENFKKLNKKKFK